MHSHSTNVEARSTRGQSRDHGSVMKWSGLLLAAALVSISCGGSTPAPTDASGVDSGSGGDSGAGTDAGGDAGGMAGDAGGEPGDAGDGDGDGGAIGDAGEDASGGDGGGDDAGALGCADGRVECPSGERCCSGVPYPEGGVCRPECTMRSDRNAKHAIRRIDADAMLERLASLPIAEWSYRDESGVRHVGPMAQDFRATFELGADDRVIHPVDANGVTMAAVQALHRRVESLRDAQDALSRENAALRAELAEISSRARCR